MKKAFTGILASLLLVTTLAGCGTESAAPQNTASGDAGTKNEAKKAGKLTLYSPNAAEVNNPIIKEFQDRTGIEVQLISGGTGDLLKRVQAEAVSPQGDVFWAGGADSLEAYKKFFEPYKTKENDNLLPEYVDKNGVWTPFAALPMVIMYNKELVKAGEEPKSWNDLLDPKWKGKIAYADPAKSGSSYTQLVTMLTAFGKDDKGWDFVKKFVKNLDGKVLSGSGLVYKGVADKEFAIGITLEEAALRYVEGGAKVGIVYPSEGTSAVPDGAAIIKGAPNMEQAKQFIDFLVGKDVQSLIQKEFKRRSVRKDAEAIQGIIQTKDIKLVNYDFDFAASKKDDNIKHFSKIITGAE
ncbi:ABC transporter substrate-binding protein [Paenibacillus tyrfis]|uniref:ABC transporter substrate-binding protein n=1 Tax=Paenibacillus tyrfis TaxID=1501230 RepID=UPI00209E3DA0|nr:ABC transporter substrate-binding protein [Paenibacillus tyrfis]MCP1307983.1 ABC transporter substrate-binding protein [Paenibacillus tyrfis]